MNSEQLQKWALVAEIISAFAIVISLIYIGFELRANTQALKATSRQEFAAQDIAFLSTGLDPVVIARARSKGRTGEELSPLEESQLISRQFMNIQIFNHAFYQYEVGALDESEYARYKQISRNNLCSENNDFAARAFNGSLAWRDDFRGWGELALANCNLPFEELLEMSEMND